MAARKKPDREAYRAAALSLAADPLKFVSLCWPQMQLYARQREVLLSVQDNVETFVHAANETGKTRIAAVAVLWFFTTRTPARVVTSSSSETQLNAILWTEIHSLISTSRFPLPFLAKSHCRGGDLSDPAGEAGLLRKVIHIDGRDSPNVQAGMRWKQAGNSGPPPVLISGLLSYEEFLRREHRWDEVQRTTRLYGHFYEGDRAVLFPTHWLDAAMDAGRWAELQRKPREVEAIGVDVAAGGRDNTCRTLVDSLGIVEQIVIDTPNTMEIPGRTIRLIEEHNLSAVRSCTAGCASCSIPNGKLVCLRCRRTPASCDASWRCFPCSTTVKAACSCRPRNPSRPARIKALPCAGCSVAAPTGPIHWPWRRGPSAGGSPNTPSRDPWCFGPALLASARGSLTRNWKPSRNRIAGSSRCTATGRARNRGMTGVRRGGTEGASGPRSTAVTHPQAR